MSGIGVGTVWISGLSASGKSTLASGLCERLLRIQAADPLLIDGEYMRARLDDRYGHSLTDRESVLRHLVDEAARVTADRRLAVVATISHTRDMRSFARQHLVPFMEVYLDCPAQVCAARDRKGHYARAARGEYDCFIGVTHPYEPWAGETRPELVLDTQAQEPDQSLAILVDAVLARFAHAHPTPAAPATTRLPGAPVTR
ncbi:MAG: adenylyl-sulfate kinase [Pseudomonadota bacterium]